MNTEDILMKINTAKTTPEVAKLYDKWSKSYDHDLKIIRPGNKGAFKTVEWFVKYVHADASVLDAGSGTGGVGELLFQRGYLNLTGMDISSGMLTEAKEKNIYKELHLGGLGEELKFPKDIFEAVISVGLFTPEHPPPTNCFDELIRVTKSGGYIVFLLHNGLIDEFKVKLEELEKNAKWTLVERSPIIRTVAKSKIHPGSRVHVYQV